MSWLGFRTEDKEVRIAFSERNDGFFELELERYWTNEDTTSPIEPYWALGAHLGIFETKEDVMSFLHEFSPRVVDVEPIELRDAKS